MMKARFTVLALLGAACSAAAVLPTPAAGAKPAPLGDLGADTASSPLAFFRGHWSCKGGTPSGRTLDADVDFTVAMNGRWLESRHVDRAPGRYEALQLWPLRADSALTTIYDNFGGARRFTTRGWTGDSVVWTRDTTETGARLETFTYRRLSDSTYWYAWHARRTADTPLVLGDSATCRRA